MAEEKVTKSKKDLFRERVAQRKPDLDMENEDAYYDYASSQLDELDKRKEMEENFNGSVMKSPLFAEMLLASRDNADFDPILWALEEDKIDLDALQSDPEYREKLAEANKKALEKRAKNEEIKKAYEENIVASMDAIKAKADELGLTDEQGKEVFEKYYQACFDATEGKYYPELFETIAKGMNYDNDVKGARDMGYQEGQTAKVTDKLRKMPEQVDAPRGRQTAVAEAKPEQPKKKNPFMDEEESV